MLFSVEGGGFFSSSASGYTNGLALLLLGQKNEEKNLKASPWNQYQLVHQEVDHDLHLASRKSQVPQGCSSFTCFGCVSVSNDGSSHPKAGHFHHSETLSSSDRAKVTTCVSADENERKIWLKSSLKKPSTNCCVMFDDCDGACEKPSTNCCVMLDDCDGACNSLEEVQSNISCFNGRRNVQWSDTCGKELTDIREFELSDDGISDDQLEHKRSRRCGCLIQ